MLVLELVLELVSELVELVVVLNEDELVEDFTVSENVLDDRKMDAE